MPTALELYEKIRHKLGDEESRNLLEYISTSVEKHAATKEDLGKTENNLNIKFEQLRSANKEDLGKTENNLNTKIEQFRNDLELKIEQVKSDLELKIEKTRADIIKWMFLFWIGQLASLIAILQTFFKK
jgi:hypothetical protein